MERAEGLIREIRKGILLWYPFEQESTILYIGNDQDALAEMLSDRAGQFVCASCKQICELNWQNRYRNLPDYIVSVESLECQQNLAEVLKILRRLLKSDGKLLLGMNNRLGLRYFCGDQDPYTGSVFDGLEGYGQVYTKKEDDFWGRCYSRYELRKMLCDAGWNAIHFFSVLPELNNAALIYSENYVPNEDLATRISPVYNNPDTVFLDERPLYNALKDNEMFHQTANAYLIECSVSGSFCDIMHVTVSLERGRKNSLFTMIHKSGIVEKRAVYPEGEDRLKELVENRNNLAARGISMVKLQLKESSCLMPYVKTESGQVYLKRLLETDRELFLQEMDHFRDLILQSSKIVKPDRGDGDGAVLRYGYPDMVPLNSFYRNGTFVFYDQEFCMENYPANAVIFRMINSLYGGNSKLQKYLHMNVLFERYGLVSKLNRWRKLEREFLMDLRNDEMLWSYHDRHRCRMETLETNRRRINFSEDSYQKYFVDIFSHADDRKLIIFGSGSFAKKFIVLYGRDYPVYAVIDNNENKWGQELEGITIHAPEFLDRLESDEYKVLICMKNYQSVLKQIRKMGVKEYGIYDSARDYPHKRKTAEPKTADPHASAQKKYHTGYIAGVFDLFHIGHLNMFKRAREQCDYLIVGVVSDEGVRKNKNVEPFFPF